MKAYWHSTQMPRLILRSSSRLLRANPSSRGEGVTAEGSPDCLFVPETDPVLPAVEPVLLSEPIAGLGAVVPLGVEPGDAGAGVADGPLVEDGLPLVEPLPDEELEPLPVWAVAAPAMRPLARIAAENVR